MAISAPDVEEKIKKLGMADFERSGQKGPKTAKKKPGRFLSQVLRGA